MRQFFAFLFLILSISSFGQQIDKEEYISITKTVLSNMKLVVNLKEYSHFDNHPVYDTETVFILDTVFVNEEIYVKNSSPKFWISNLSNLKAAYVNYWLMPTDIQFQNEKIYYHFKSQSINRQDNAVYISGIITINHNDNKYQIESAEIDEYDFFEPYEIECENPIECKTDLNYPKASRKNSPFFGNWQYLIDSTYYEAFFSDDTIYIFDEFFGRNPFDLKYEVHGEKILIQQHDSSLIEREFEFLNKNQIKLSGTYSLLNNQDSLSFILNRLSEKEFNQNDIKCWGEKNEKFDCYRESIDHQKYYEEFWRRMWEYKAKIWGKN